MILNSFKYSGISNSLNGSEDYQFRGNEDIDKGSKIIQIENDELYLNDDYVASIDSHE